MNHRKRGRFFPLDNDPLWYKDAIIYELHVRSFADSNGDGIGDFRGLVHKLDYLHDLGITALWLLPFYPSPLKDDGYDTSYYTNVNSIYGTLADCKLLLREAHRRGLRVITELIVNHTSDQHPWFQRARRAPPGSSWRNFYVWSDTPDRYREARIIFSDFEKSNWGWDADAKAYYWHRFYAHQPDLNYDNPAVHEAVMAALDFWLELGIDGLRLDAVPYLYEREGTNCENLPETHAFLKKLRGHVDERFRNRMLLAEANQWPEDAVAYFGNGDACHMAFHFPLMPRLFMSIHMEDRFPVIDILKQTPAIPDMSQWAIFLRNHDELTLEMVTDEDRDYMYKVYAQDAHARINLGIRRRLAPLLENHRGKIELMNGLLFSLPGTPVIYYGDEIGMGDNIYLGDRNGVRTPMQWNPERNAGFSAANPQRLFLPVIIDPEYHYQTINVEAQQNNQHALLWWMKRLIGLRKRFQAFSRGTLDFLYPENHKVLAFIRSYRDERILVVANLSRSMQCAQLDLSAFQGMVPVEMLGRTALPAVAQGPYMVTLGPYAFYWLALQPKAAPHLPVPGVSGRPTLEVMDSWDQVFEPRFRATLESALLSYMRGQHWFLASEGDATTARIAQTIHVPDNSGGNGVQLTLIEVEYLEGEPQTFLVPLAFAPGVEAEQVQNQLPDAAIARLRVLGARAEVEGLVFDAMGEPGFSAMLFAAFARHRRFRGPHGAVQAWTTRAFHRLRGLIAPPAEPVLLRGEHSNTSVAYGDRLILKLYRRVEEGIHPDVEVSRALAEKTSFAHAPPLAGALDYRSDSGTSTTLAVLHGFLPHEGDARSYTLESLLRYFGGMLTQQDHREPPFSEKALFECLDEDLPAAAADLIGPYLETARLLGRRTAEMHLALASVPGDAAFAPEPFTMLYQRSLYQTARTRALRVLDLLREHMNDFPDDMRGDARRLGDRESLILGRLRSILEQRITGERIRTHGDYRLNNLLYTGKDFHVIDFEAEATRPLSNRRHKKSPVRDLASLLLSWYRAVRAALKAGDLRHEDRPLLAPWGRFWHFWVTVAFLQSYLKVAGSASFLPATRDELRGLLQFYVLSRGLFELRSQLLRSPERAHPPLQALLHLMDLWERRPSGEPAAQRPQLAEHR